MAHWSRSQGLMENSKQWDFVRRFAEEQKKGWNPEEILQKNGEYFNPAEKEYLLDSIRMRPGYIDEWCKSCVSPWNPEADIVQANWTYPERKTYRALES
jgi:hypothetical protein